MATTEGNTSIDSQTSADLPRAVRPSRPGWRDVLLEGRPMVGMVAILLTTGGHTMNLREMGVSQGWVAAVVYSTQSSYLVSLALMMLACPRLAQRWSCRTLTQGGLCLAALGSIPHLIVMDPSAPLTFFLIGRVAAGAGAGMVIYFTPRLLDHRWHRAMAGATILCPAAGLGAVSLATMYHETSNWRSAFLFEGVAAAVGLLALLSMSETHESPPRAPRGPLGYVPLLAVASAALLYALHWGQLHGWTESPDIVAAWAICGAALTVALWMVRPHLDWGIIFENWTRLTLFFFGGLCQFFFGYIMNVYGGMTVDLSSWQRDWLIWPLPIGIAIALVLARVRWRHRRVALGLPGAIVGLGLLAAGFYLCYDVMMNWPYWNIREVADLNWFQAPGYLELAPGRFLMGLGIGLFMISMETQSSPDPDREETVQPLLHVLQFYGGGIAAALLINFLIIGHKIHYSYSAERGTIQAEELERREAILSSALQEAGHVAPHHAAEVLMYRFINYEADNLVFATIYAVFFLNALALAVIFLAVWLWRRLLAPPRPRAP